MSIFRHKARAYQLNYVFSASWGLRGALSSWGPWPIGPGACFHGYVRIPMWAKGSWICTEMSRELELPCSICRPWDLMKMHGTTSAQCHAQIQGPTFIQLPRGQSLRSDSWVDLGTILGPCWTIFCPKKTQDGPKMAPERPQMDPK